MVIQTKGSEIHSVSPEALPVDRPEQIRALHVLRHDPGHSGGDIQQLRATVRALQDQRVDALAGTVNDAPAKIDVVHLYNLWRPLDLRRDYALARKRWPRARVVLSPIFWSWPPAAVVRGRNRRLWRHVFRSASKMWASWLSCRRILDHVDAVVPMSWSELQVIQRYYRITPRPNWRVIPIGIWVRDWPLARRPDRERLLNDQGLNQTLQTVVACAAGMYPRKNQWNLVKAVAALEGHGLILSGPMSDPVYARRVFRFADRVLPGRWAWLGLLPQPKLHEIFSITDVGVLPSYQEPLGLASLEAAATGCEVVVSTNSGAREYLDDTAHICEPHDSVSIAEAIETAMREPKQPATRERVEEYDWSRTGSALARLYRDLMRFPPVQTG